MNIGLSSGKVSQYLQHGIPVIAVGIGEPLKTLLRDYACGICLDRADEIRLHLDGVSTSGEPACRALFVQHFDLNRTGAALLAAVTEATRASH